MVMARALVASGVSFPGPAPGDSASRWWPRGRWRKTAVVRFAGRPCDDPTVPRSRAADATPLPIRRRRIRCMTKKAGITRVIHHSVLRAIPAPHMVANPIRSVRQTWRRRRPACDPWARASRNLWVSEGFYMRQRYLRECQPGDAREDVAHYGKRSPPHDGKHYIRPHSDRHRAVTARMWNATATSLTPARRRFVRLRGRVENTEQPPDHPRATGRPKEGTFAIGDLMPQTKKARGHCAPSCRDPGKHPERTCRAGAGVP